MQQYCQAFKKQPVDISNILSELMLLASTYVMFLYYNLKQYQFLVIDLPNQLVFKMALYTSYSRTRSLVLFVEVIS